MESNTLGGAVREAIRDRMPVPIREGRVRAVKQPGLFLVSIRSLMGDSQPVEVRGPEVELAAGTTVWVARDEGGQLVLVAVTGTSETAELSAAIGAVGTSVTALTGRVSAVEGALFDGPSGARSRTTTGTVSLTGGPSVTVTKTGTYVVTIGADIQSMTAGLFNGTVRAAIGGTPTGRTLFYVGTDQYSGASVHGSFKTALTAGNVLTLVVANTSGAGTVQTDYSNGTIEIRPV